MSLNSRQTTQSLKRCTQDANWDGPSILVGKKIFGLLLGVAQAAQVRLQPQMQVRCERYTPLSIESPSASTKKTRRPIDVVLREAKSLTHQNSCCIQEKNQHPQRRR